jgi:hypothetical protein
MQNRILMCIVAAFSVAACARDATGPQPPDLTHSLAIAPSDPTADGVVQGTVQGFHLTNPSDSTSFEHVAGARIAVYLQFTQLPADSSAGVLHTLVGTLTTDAQGNFELDHVPNGYYELDVTPPTGSPFQPGTSGTVAFAAHASERAIVWLSN